MSGAIEPRDPGDGGLESGPDGGPGDPNRGGEAANRGGEAADRGGQTASHEGDDPVESGEHGDLRPADTPSRLVLTLAPFVLAALLWWLLAVLVA